MCVCVWGGITPVPLMRKDLRRILLASKERNRFKRGDSGDVIPTTLPLFLTPPELLVSSQVQNFFFQLQLTLNIIFVSDV